MSLKKVEEVKLDKGFKIFDLVLYGVVLALVAAVFLSVFLTRNNDPFKGVQVLYRGVCVYEYLFDEGGRAFDERVEESTIEGKVTVKLTLDEGYNIIEIDAAKKSVTMIEADCSISPDCVYMPAIADNNRFISCEPHRVQILPVKEDDGKLLV